MPSGNDPSFYAILVFGDGVGDDNDHESADHPHCLPSLFAVFVAILFSDREGIEEDSRRRLEADAMLAEVGTVLFRIPIPQHYSTV